MPLGCPWDASPATETGKNARIWTNVTESGPNQVHVAPFEFIFNQNESYKV